MRYIVRDVLTFNVENTDTIFLMLVFMVCVCEIRLLEVV